VDSITFSKHCFNTVEFVFQIEKNIFGNSLSLSFSADLMHEDSWKFSVLFQTNSKDFKHIFLDYLCVLLLMQHTRILPRDLGWLGTPSRDYLAIPHGLYLLFYIKKKQPINLFYFFTSLHLSLPKLLKFSYLPWDLDRSWLCYCDFHPVNDLSDPEVSCYFP